MSGVLTKFKIVWLSFICRACLSKKSPNTIPLSGWDRLRKRNYVSLYFDERQTGFAFLAEAHEGKGLRGIYFDQPYGGGPIASISFSHLISLRFKPEYFYKDKSWRIYSPLWFSIFHFFRIYIFIHYYSLLAQGIFNARRVRHSEREEILNWALEVTWQNTDPVFSVDDFLVEKHGRRVQNHPDRNSLRRYCSLVFDALADEDAFARVQSSFRVAPRGFSIADREKRENHRHRDLVVLQQAIIVLTAMLVLSGFLTFLTQA